MTRICASVVLVSLLSVPAFGQVAEPAPRFEIADVHVSAKSTSQFARSGPARGGRYEVKTATMVDLIRFAYAFDPDKVLGGPNWLEMDRFDVIAKMPPETPPETQRLMLQSLLEDRFKLAVHKDVRPLPTYALTVGKKAQLKEADGAGDSGCKPQSPSGPPPEGGIRMMTSLNGVATTFNLGPGMTIQFQCRNMTMQAFAAGLRGMMGASIGPSQVLDQTGLKGAWNFDVKWSAQIMGPMMANAGDRITVFDALEKQLGLKLEQRQIPTPVIVVDSVNRNPGDNPPGVAEALPPVAAPKEFEVADVKPTDPATRMGRFQMQPGGRLSAQGMPMRFLVNRAFNTNNNDQVVGLPKWADTERFDITAKAQSAGLSSPMMDMESVAPLMLALLADRFKMTYHTEERPVSAYSLVAAKPKMKKADPASRTFCKDVMDQPGAPPGSRTLSCQNITMAQFADRLQNMAQGLNWPVLDATALDGSWDFNLTFSRIAPIPAMMMGPGRGANPAGDVPAASDPTGVITIFEAVEKQLGLKLETQKRPMPVIVIDHIEQRPTEN